MCIRDSIRAVGSKQQLEAAFGPGAEAFDLQGRTLMPAFIDPQDVYKRQPVSVERVTAHCTVRSISGGKTGVS